jgi:iron complex outermembrane receptor protein
MYRSCSLALLMGAIALTPSAALHAQLLEEVIVTAQKKEQSQQDVGVSVTAFTEHQLSALGWDNSLDVAAQTPGLVTTSNTGDTANIALFSIRGVSQLDFAEGQEAPVALYRDEVYISSPGASGIPFFDLERVEILRGPQGTLYGRNATGGLIHFISNKPTDVLEGFIEVTVGQFAQRGVTTAVSGPLSDTAQARLSLYSNQDQGYVKNALGPDKRADDTQSLRAMLNFDISESTSLLLLGQFTSIDTSGGVFHSVASKTDASGAIVFCRPGDTDCGDFTADQPVGTNGFFYGGALFDAAGGRIDDGVGDELEGAYDRQDSGVDRDTKNFTGIFKRSIGDSMELVSVTDLTTSDKVYAEEDDSTRYAVVTYDATADIKQFSEELRLSGGSAGYEWIAGVYYLQIENDFSGAFAFPSDGYLPRFTGDSTTDTISAFGQVDYDLSEDLLLTAGLRWIRDDKQFVYQMVRCDVTSDLAFGFCPPHLISDPTLRAQGEELLASEPGVYDLTGLLVDGTAHPFLRKDAEFSGKLQLDWRVTEDHLVYAGLSRGVKGGGFNTPTDGFDTAHIAFVGFDPEILLAYELGVKTSWADRKFRLNASVFYYDYDQFQAFFFADTTSRLINSQAEFIGGEAELTYSSGDGWDFLAGISLLDTNVNGTSPDGGTNIDDQKAPLAPEFSANGVIRKRWEMGSGGALAAQVSVNYVGTHYFNVVNEPVTEGGDYTLVDARLGYSSPGDVWEASVFANNLTDERSLTYSYDITGFGFYTIQVFGPPRWIGATVRYRFDSN